MSGERSARLWLQDTNFLTFDIEEWYHVTYKNVDVKAVGPGSVTLEALVDRLIALCGQHSVRTTCFVLGSVGAKTPAFVKKLHAAGHEIASHGCDHENVFDMTPERFRADVKTSCDVLENITGRKLLGFRAPAFSVKRETLRWFYPVLEGTGPQLFFFDIPGADFFVRHPGFSPIPAPSRGLAAFFRGSLNSRCPGSGCSIKTWGSTFDSSRRG